MYLDWSDSELQACDWSNVEIKACDWSDLKIDFHHIFKFEQSHAQIKKNFNSNFVTNHTICFKFKI